MNAPLAGEEVPAAFRDLPALQDHGCFVLAPIELIHGPSVEPTLTLQDRVATWAGGGAPGGGNAWLPESEREALLADGRSTLLWEPGAMNLGPDLYPHVRRMLGGHEGRGDAHALCYRLTDLPRRLLQGKSLAARSDAAGGRHRLVLALSNAARARIGVRDQGAGCDALELLIEDVELVLFRTGFGIVVLRCAFRTLDGTPLLPYCLVEAMASIARFNTLRWQAIGSAEHSARLPSFTLADVISSLHCGHDVGGAGRRLFTATYAQFAAAPDPDARRRFAFQLSRHYTDDYRLTPSVHDTCEVAVFENVTHTLSMEGCATVLHLVPRADGAVPEFVRNFKTVTFGRTYLPIMVLVYHEFLALLHFANDAKFWFGTGRDAFHARAHAGRGAHAFAPHSTSREMAFRRLAALRNDVLRFRLCYAFSHVSHSSLHNAVYEGLRDACGCRRMLADLAQDTAEITALLDQRLREENAARLRIFGVIGAAGLAYVSAHAFLGHVPAVGAWLGDAASPVEKLLGTGLTLAVAAVAGWVAWAKSRSALAGVDEDGELPARAVEEIVHEAAGHEAAPRPTPAPVVEER